MKPKHLGVKSGGKVLEITAVGHETYRSVADWFYVGTVLFDGATQPSKINIVPWALCVTTDTPEARAEYEAVAKELNDYLRDVGTWNHKGRKMKDGRIVFWTPKQPEGRRELKVTA